MHARCELDGADIVYLARCGNYQGSVGKNSDYGEGLRRVLECLNEHSVGIREVTVDSKQARSLPLEDRVILVEAEELGSGEAAKAAHEGSDWGSFSGNDNDFAHGLILADTRGAVGRS